MNTIYTLSDGRELRDGQAFTGPDGVKYPRNWLELATPEDLAAHQITAQDVPDPVPVVTPAILLDRLAMCRWDAEVSGTMWGDIRLPTDRERRSALKDAADKMRDGTLSAPIAVAFSASAYANVTLEQLDAAVNLITQHVQTVFSDAMGVAAQIQAGTITTIEQLDAAWATART
jgi:hypothetical protein